MAAGAVKIRAKWVSPSREKLTTRLELIAPGAGVTMGKTALRHSKRIAAIAASRAPVRTGKYRASIHGAMLADKTNAERGKSAFGRTKDPNAAGVFAEFTWRWLEFGTIKMAAQPHLMPTYRQQKPSFKRAMRAALRKAVKAAMEGKVATAAPLDEAA